MERKRILCFGDSLTWGYDPVNRVRFPEESRWTCVLEKLLGDEYKVIEEGQCGRTIATEDPAEGEKNGLSYIGPCLESHGPLDMMIVMLGSNDIKDKFNYSAMDIAGEMQRFLEKVIAYNTFRMDGKMKILLISPPLISEGVKNSWLNESYTHERAAEVSGRLADWYVQFIDMYGIEFLNAAEIVSVSPADGVHLDAEGQRKLGEAVYTKVLNSLEQ